MGIYSDLWGIYIEVELLGHMVSLTFNFLRNQLFSATAALFYVPTSNVRGPQFLHIFASILCSQYQIWVMLVGACDISLLFKFAFL